jgi:hypothetical protein
MNDFIEGLEEGTLEDLKKVLSKGILIDLWEAEQSMKMVTFCANVFQRAFIVEKASTTKYYSSGSVLCRLDMNGDTIMVHTHQTSFV